MIKKILVAVILILVLIFFGLKSVGFFENNQIKLTIGTDDKNELDVDISTEKAENEVAIIPVKNEEKTDVKNEVGIVEESIVEESVNCTSNNQTC